MAGVGVYTVRKQRKVKSTLLGVSKDHLRKEETYAVFFFFLISFGRAKSYLWHVGCLIFTVACEIFSCGMWNLVP